MTTTEPKPQRKTRRILKPRSPTAHRMAALSVTVVLPQDLAEHYRTLADVPPRKEIGDLILHDLEEYHEHMRHVEREYERLK